MISAEELDSIELFAQMSERERQRLSSKAADIRLQPGEWLIHEGDATGFFVVLEGEVKISKQIGGIQKDLFLYRPGDFFGEIPVLIGTPSVASAQALGCSRVIKFERQQLLELIRQTCPASGAILRSMNDHLHRAQQYAQVAPTVRVVVTGPKHDHDCYQIRAFLSANQIFFEWVDNDGLDQETSTHGPIGNGVKVVLDGKALPEKATLRDLAQALHLQTAPERNAYDVVIAGAGPAGMAAAVYGASEGLRVLIVERSTIGGQAGTSSRIENYLGFPAGISGNELSQRAWKQASRFGAEFVMTRSIVSVRRETDRFQLTLDGNEQIQSRSVLVATGVEWRRLTAKGVDDLLGRGVFYGAARSESFQMSGKCVFVVGAGNSAGQAAVFLSSYADQVNVLVRGMGLKATMSRYLIDQLATKANIAVEFSTVVTEACGRGRLETITTVSMPNGKAGPVHPRRADALFIMIGGEANTEWLPSELERDPMGYVRTGRDVTRWSLTRPPFPLETNLPGLFCAGDVRHGSVKRVASGVGEGSMAISFVHQYLA